MTDDYLKQSEVSEILGVTCHTLQIWRQKKIHPELKSIKMGKLIRYRKSVVEKFMIELEK